MILLALRLLRIIIIFVERSKSDLIYYYLLFTFENYVTVKCLLTYIVDTIYVWVGYNRFFFSERFCVAKRNIISPNSVLIKLLISIVANQPYFILLSLYSSWFEICHYVFVHGKTLSRTYNGSIKKNK